MGLGDLEVDGLAGGDGDAEAVEGGGGLVGLGGAVGVELVVVEACMFQNDGAGLGGSVVDGVLAGDDIAIVLAEDAFGNGDAAQKVAGRRLAGDVDGLVDGVREQTLFGGMDWIEQTLAAEVAVFDDGEGAAVEREVGGVGDPERAQRNGLLLGPERDWLGVDLGLQDGHHRRFILADGDGFGEVVGEVIVEGGGGGVGGDGTQCEVLVKLVFDGAANSSADGGGTTASGREVRDGRTLYVVLVQILLAGASVDRRLQRAEAASLTLEVRLVGVGASPGKRLPSRRFRGFAG